MSTVVYVPGDAGALSVGAEEVAATIASEAKRRAIDVRLVRNGSRGLYWLEPLVEVETPQGRVAYGPVSAPDVPSLFDSGFLSGGNHAFALGPTEDISYLRKQERLTFAHLGIIDPLSLDDYVAYGGYRGLGRALDLSPAQIIEEVSVSGLRGRGGAGFPAGIKWKTALEAQADQKYIIANADEGDSGTFSDRMLMEGDPFELIEGMTIAAITIGASEGYIYLRSEYPHARRVLTEAIETAYRRSYLGRNILGTKHTFDIEVRIGAGSYVCGEETAMLESLEGKRGMVRPRPPVPAVSGLFGKPTIVNNVISLASIPIIIEKGGQFFQEFGVGRSRGTLPIQLAGNAKHPGLIELPFGVTLGEIVYDYGGGTASGRPVRAVQIGGPLGAYFPETMLDTTVDYEAVASRGGILGHGGIVVFDDTVDLAQMARYAMEFCAIESCGKCTPCRIGSTRGMEIIDHIRGNQNRSENIELLHDLCDALTNGSLCALGGLLPTPVLSAIKYFPEDFGLSNTVP